jgi:type IV pilus assembly protein PilY1
MKLKLLNKIIFGALLTLTSGSALFAEDIDLYVGGEAATGAETNVLIVLDNSANWSNASGWPKTQGEAELEALSTIIKTLPDTINVGVLMHVQDGSGKGAYVRYAVRSMGEGNRSRLDEIFGDIKSTAPNAPQDKVSQSHDGDNAIEEAFRYFIGANLGFPSVRDKKEDYDNNIDYYVTGGSVSTELAAKNHPTTGLTPGVTNLFGNAYASSTATQYIPPSSAGAGCAKNYIIWIGNTALDGSTNGSRLQAAAALIGETADVSQISVPANGYPGARMFDEWTRFMSQYGVPTTIDDPRRPGKKILNPILTYTVDVFPASDPSNPPATCLGDLANGQGAQQIGQHYVMQSAATAGGGKCYPATNVDQLAQSLKLIFAEIQAVNSVFASASLPVSVNTQGTYENQIYIGVFRPDANARPRWLGNLKQYKFGRYCDENDNDVVDAEEAIADTVLAKDIVCPPNPSTLSTRLKLFMADRNNEPAIDQNNSTGFIDTNATSFWTTPQTPGFWTFFPDPTAGTDDSPDGPLVERGGAAYKLRNQFASGRNVYTCLGSCLSSVSPSLSAQAFSTANSAVVSALTLTGSKSVTLTRSGAVVTATASGAHGFNDGDTLTISGPSVPADYLGSFSVSTSGPTSSAFTYTVAERPADDASGNARVSITQPQNTLGQIAITVSDWTTGAATATAALTSETYSIGDNLLITGASQTFLNSGVGGASVTASVSGASFSYQINVPVPATPATVNGTSKIGLNNFNNAGVQRRQNLVVVDAGANVDGIVVGGSTLVTVAGVTPAEYNVTARVIEAQGTACNGKVTGFNPVPTTGNDRKRYYCFRLFSSPEGAGAKAQKILDPKPIYITRVVGSQTATATLVDTGDTITGSPSQLTISGTTGYDGTWTLDGSNYALGSPPRSFTFGPVTLSPAAPTGSYTATPGAGSVVVTASSLIEWVRGKDVAEDENQNASKLDVRASIHADVLHSRPLMLNFGSDDGGIVGFYGSNDGMLHAIKGGNTDADGTELWSFIPEEFVSYSKLSRLYLNQPVIRFPNLQCGINPPPQPRDYFWDGVISGYQSPDGTATTAPSKSWIYATMRRGGRAVYAFDVTDPIDPQLKWRINNTTPGFAELAQTWSEVKIVDFKGVVIDGDGVSGPATVKAAIFGAGYNAPEEDKPAGSARLAATMGGGVYVVNADTGAKLAFLEPPVTTPAIHKYSFAGDVSPYDSDGDGFIDRIYAADTGGNVFRWDLNKSAAPGTVWTAHHLAKLGDVANNGGSDARKFLFPPALVPFKDPVSLASGVMVMVGSGDREKPLKNPVINTCSAYFGGVGSAGNPVQDRFYAVADKVLEGAASTVTPVVESDLLEVNATPSALTPFSFSSTKKGWYITLKNDADSNGTPDEEKTVNAPQVVGGVVYFASNTPQTPDISQGICSNLGQALGYAVNPYTGLPVFDRDGSGLTNANNYASIFEGGGLPPTVTSGVVMIGGQPYYGIIGAGGPGTSGSSLGGSEVKQVLPPTRKKVYWYYKVD